MESVKLITEDNITIFGNYYPGTVNIGILCLHQNKSDKSSYESLAKILNHDGYHVLTIDFRGHGESEGTYESLTDQDYINMFLDARSADDYLKRINSGMKVHVIGASIGANTALRYQEMNTIESVIALSPGLNYHGINREDALLGNIAIPILFISSEGDPYVQESKQLYDLTSIPTTLKKLSIYTGSKHGIFILEEHPDAVQEILDWIKTH